MSWSMYFHAESPAAAKAHVESMREPTAEANYGVPHEAKDIVIKMIDNAHAEGSGVKVDACGSHNCGISRVVVEPVTFIKER